MKNNLIFEKVLLVCNRNADLLRLVQVVEANFDSNIGFSQKDEEEKFVNSDKFAEKNSSLFVLFTCRC